MRPDILCNGLAPVGRHVILEDIWEFNGRARRGGHEATDIGLAYVPVSQAHGHHHIVQCFACCTAVQTSSVPHQVVADCALALALWALRSARTHYPPTVPVSL